MSDNHVRVLLIDDDPEDLELTTDALHEAKRLSFSVCPVSDPEEALDSMCSGQFDVVLLDYRMGATDGLSILREARGRGCRMPVVMLTGQKEDSLAEDALEAGVADYLEKGALDAPLLERTVRYAIERVRAFRELDDAANRIRFMLDVTPGIAWEADADGNLLYVSKRWREIVGSGSDGDNLFSAIHTDDRQLAIESWSDCREKRKEWRAEYRLKVASGGYRWVLSRATRGDASADASPWIGLTVTVDEQKELELELQRRVEERTAELQDAQRELESVSYSMVHDMRSPVRAIIASSTEMLMDYPGMEPVVADGLVRQQKVGRRMHGLVDGMIQYIRLIRADLSPSEVDVTRICQEIKSELELSNRLYGAALRIQPGMQIQGDQAIVTILMRALIENAVKFRRKDVPNVVEVQQVAGENGVFIKDTGIGFNEIYLPKMLLPFERLHREDQYPGVGIGLALARRAVGRHGGELKFQAEEGTGTSVSFFLGDLPGRDR